MTQLTNNPWYFNYKWATRDIGDARDIPVSTDFTPEENYWVTVPWDTTVISPNDPAAPRPQPTPTSAVWSFLYGPCYFSITAAVGTFGEPGASTHLQLVDYNNSEQLMVGREGWEWFIGDGERNSSHWTGAWNGYLSTGNKLRLRLDYWNGTEPCKMIRAHVEGFYWRP